MARIQSGQDVTLIFTTIARDKCARRLIESAQLHYPELAILVADQNPPTVEMKSFYRNHGVRVHWVPYDFGVSAGRAELARKVKTPFLLYGDDDFVFTNKTRIAPVIDYLNARPEVALVTGGMTDQVTDKNGNVRRYRRRYENYLYTDRLNRGLIAIPIDHIDPKVDLHNGELFYKTDIGLNWAMARASLFYDERFLWDKQFKTNGEHENFFLQIKEFGGGQVMYFPEMECDHISETTEDYGLLRSRNAGWAAFGKKWNLDWFLHTGIVFHRYEDYDRSMIKLEAGAPGSSQQLPPRPFDYLRVWENGTAAASVSSRSRAIEANDRARSLRINSEERILALQKRLEAAEEESRRLAQRNDELQERLRTEVQPTTHAPPGSADQTELVRTVKELREKVRGLLELVAKKRNEISRLRAKIGEESTQ